MKKIFGLLSLFAILLMVGSCAVNSTTGSITVQNRTDKDALNVKVGSVNIGFVGKGTNTVVYFFSEEKDAQVVVDGFSSQVGVNGKIDLKLKYSYSLMFLNNSLAAYYYTVSGTEINDSTKFAPSN